MIQLKNKDDIKKYFSGDIITDVFEKRSKKEKILFSNDIQCFDIEVTSLFEIDGEFKPFDYTKPKEYYLDKEKVALPYIWQFGYNNNVYYSRDFYLFADLLETIYNENITQFIFIHNLSYEFHFLLNIFKKRNFTITEILARGLRKVISFKIEELNIIFRCSYALTNLSLAKSGKQFNTEHSKLIGDLDYNIPRSPKTKLTKQEMMYCENDILVMYEFLSIYKEEYGAVANIPLTQTGEVRKELNKRVNYFYHKKIWETIPNSHIYQLLMWAFMGGITHANMIHSGKVLTNVTSVDYSSSYPFRMATCYFPSTEFFEIDEDEIEYFKEKCCLLYHVKIYGFKSKLRNNYIPSSKCEGKKHCRYDNGRLISGEEIEICVTDIDFQIIQESYNIEDIEYLEIYASYKRYLPKEIIEFILEFYEKKTTLKGIEEQDYLYKKSKAKINSLYGCAVTNPLKQNYDFNINGIEDEQGNKKIWKSKEFSENFINEKLAEMKKSYSVLFSYSCGCWVTAYARAGLWQLISAIDKDSAYFDTDSDKILNFEKHKHIIDRINEENYQAIKDVCEHYEIDIERFSPKDKKGNKHTLGLLEYDGFYSEFKTLGAKKYCYREDGKLHMTLSGVRKSAVSQLNNDINNFKKGFEFNYSINKLNMLYAEGQEPFEFKDKYGKSYICDDIEFSIIAQPTTYTLGITREYEMLLEFMEEGQMYF